MENKLAVQTGSCSWEAGRHFLALSLVCALIFSLSACGGQKTTGKAEEIKPVTVEHEPEPKALQTANEATAIALRQYVYARLLTEAFLTADASAMTAEELSEMADELLLVWENAELFSSTAMELANQAVLLLEIPAVKQTSAVGQPQAKFMTLAAAPLNFSLVAYAAESGRKIDPQTWAENLTRQYDALKGEKRYQQLAQQLGTDAKAAYEQMALAQEIIHGGAMEKSERLNLMIKVAQTIKTTSKVTMLGWSMVATGGGSVALLEGAGLLVGGVDCIVDVAETGSTLILGENNQVAVAFGDIKEKLGPVSSLVGLATLNPAEVGKTAKDTAEAVVYITDSLMDLFYEDKIVGIKVEGLGLSEHTHRISGQIFEEGTKAVIEAAGFLYPKTTKAISQLAELWKPDQEAMIARIDALVSQMAVLEQAAGITEEAPTEPDSTESAPLEHSGEQEPQSSVPSQITVGDINIFGRYTVETTSEEGGTDTMTVTLSDAGGGRVLWQAEEDEYEEDEYEDDDGYAGRAIMSYNESTHTLHYKIEAWTVNVTFVNSEGTAKGSGYMSGVIWEQPFKLVLDFTKISD